MKKIILLLLVGLITQISIAQSTHKLLRNGNSAYEKEDYATAAENYYKALENDPSNVKGKFNLGNATYHSEGFDEAVLHFSAAAELAKDDVTKSNAYYNLGNTYFQKAQAEEGKGLEESIEAYKNSLRLNPNDIDTKKNLALTQRLLQRQQQQQKQQQQEQDKEQDKQDQQEQQQQQQEQQQNESGENEEDKKPESQEEQAAKDLNKEEALELLKIMEEEEKKVQEKLQKVRGDGKKPEKDW